MTEKTSQAFDEARAEEFGNQLVGTYMGAAKTLIVDLGHRSGLWESLAQGPATSVELAERSGLNERYVREWLGGATVSGYLDYDVSTKSHTLPAEHAASLTGETGANLSSLSPMITFLGGHVSGVLEAFRNGGGVPYSEYRPEFTEVMDDFFRRDYNSSLFDGYIGVVPGLVERLEGGISVCDVGCGTGHNMNLMAQAYPKSTFKGYDLAEDAIASATLEANEMGLTNVTFEVQDVTDLPSDVSFDLITAFDSIHDQVNPQGALNEASSHLSLNGAFMMIDIKASSNLEDNIEHPVAPFFYAVSTLHCMTVSLAEGGAGLGTVWGEQLAVKMLHDAGLPNVRVLDSSNPFNSIYVCTK